MTNRRTFLRGIAPVAIAATAGCGPIRAHLARLARGCPAAPARPSGPAAKTVATHLPSTHVAGGAGIVVVMPPRPVRRVVFALPGRGGTAEETAGDLDGYTTPFAETAFVCVDGGESYWHPRSSGEDRLGLLIGDVVPWVRATMRGVRPPFGLIGWSMGAFGAIAAAEHRPDLFDRVCAASPAIWQSRADQSTSVTDAFDGDADFAAYEPFSRAATLRHTRVRIVCGSSDAFFVNARAFVKTLRAAGVPCEFEPVPNGCHEVETWHQTMPADLAFASRA